jgi:hypothetical protein
MFHVDDVDDDGVGVDDDSVVLEIVTVDKFLKEKRKVRH